jgi:response regulator RpfG family c-di-GMP phosphodiesterase
VSSCGLRELAFRIQQTNGDQLAALISAEDIRTKLRVRGCTALEDLLSKKAEDVRCWLTADQLNRLEMQLNYFGLRLGMSPEEITEVQNGLVLPVEFLT